MPSIRISEFDTWRPGYGLATVSVLQANTDILASIFNDEALTSPAANPLTLNERVDAASGISYGRFAAPLYVGMPYELQINSVDTTGIVRPPLTTLDAQDASNAVVTIAGGTQPYALADSLARRIDVRDYGLFVAAGQQGASASTNTTTLNATVGAAAALGGAYVEIPAGTYDLTQFTLSQGVVLRGLGREVTILQSTSAGNVATIAGPQAGFTKLTLDGVTLVSTSIGVYAEGVDQIMLEDVEIKRFETGMRRKGGRYCDWYDLYISNCVNGYKGHGDSALGNGGGLMFNRWTGGKIELCTGLGLDLRNVDTVCEHNFFRGVTFDTNTGTAVNIVGARYFAFADCWWLGNTNDITVNDGSPLTNSNSVVAGEFEDGEIDGGILSFTGTYQAIVFRRMALLAPTVTINAPGQNIAVEDCQVSNATITGVPTCWLYRQTVNDGASFGTTTGNGNATIWSLPLRSGQQVYLEAKVIGRQRDGVNTVFAHVAVSAGRPGATLNYTTQTGNFTLGGTLTGGTSGATARITAATNSGATGSLTLQDIIGTFINNEALTDGAGGVAVASGGASGNNAALVGSVTSIRAIQRTNANYTATIVASGPNIIVQVAGDSGQTVEWSCHVDVLTDQQGPLILAQSNAPITVINYHGGSSSMILTGFLVGQLLTDMNSGATGIITSTTGPGASGTVKLRNVVGNFTSGDSIKSTTIGGSGISTLTAIVN